MENIITGLLTSTIPKLSSGKIIGYFGNKASALLSAISKAVPALQSSINLESALISALQLGIEEIEDWPGSDQSLMDEGAYIFEISNDTANTFAQNLAAVGEQVKARSDSGTCECQVTLITGEILSLFISDDVNDYLQGQGLKFFDHSYNSWRSIIQNFEGTFRIAPVLFTNKFTPIHLLDVVGQLVQTIDLNEAIISVSQLLLAHAQDLSLDLLNTAFNAIKGATRCVIDFKNNVNSAFMAGGFLSVAYYVLSFFRTTASLTAENGVLQFTDNSTLVPQQFIVGILETVFTTAQAIATAIISYFNVGIGMAFSALTSIARGIFQSIKYNSDNTRVAINTAAGVQAPIAPWALVQGNFRYSTMTNKEWIIEALQLYPAVLLDVPGGHLIIGVYDYTESGTINRIAYEFHPSLLDYRDKLTNSGFWTEIDAHITSTSTVSSPSAATWLASRELAITLENIWFTGPDIFVDGQEEVRGTHDITNGANGTVSVDDDYLCRQIMTHNLSIFYYWAMYRFGDSLATPQRINISWNNTNFIDMVSYLVSIPKYYYDVKTTSLSSYSDPRILFAMTITGTWSIQDWPTGVTTTFTGCLLDHATWTGFGNFVKFMATQGGQNPGTPGMSLSTGIATYLNKQNLRTCYTPILGGIEYAVIPAKYESSNFWTYVIIATAAVVAFSVAAVVVKYKASKWISTQRAKRTARIESAWAELTAHPSDANYMAYRKAVRSNNRIVKLFGGTKYSTESYWGTVDSGGSLLSSILTSESGNENTATGNLLNRSISKQDTADDKLDKIISLITGPII